MQAIGKRMGTGLSRVGRTGSATRDGAGKASIIVVTYNNLEYTRLTLESVIAKTAYPRYEIVVVDNGSDSDLRDWLTLFAQAHANQVRLIFNERNLGFSAANNIGIRAAADSEYIVLLNNDCIVTRGWLARLIRHLRDPQVGMVGPVTNFAGNESAVNIDYYRLDDLDRFARQYTFYHRKRSFDIPMLAMFCVVMRRSLMEEIGPLDEQFGAGMFEDDDYAQRVHQAGYRIICAEDVFVHHFGRSSFSKLADTEFAHLFTENRARFEAKWRLTWQPPRQRPGIMAEPWVEHLAHHRETHPDTHAGATPTTALSMSLAVLAAPLRIVHKAYHAAIPYDTRITLWSWRRRKTFHLRLLRESLRRNLVRACQSEIWQIMAQYPDSKGVVIFPPSLVPWYTDLFQRPQQMALAFAQLGYVVLYWVEEIDPQDESVRFRKVAERLHLCKAPPAAFWVCQRPIVVSYTYNYQWATFLRSPIIVYELIDHLDIFSTFSMRTLRRAHRRLLRRADLVVGTADDLLAELKPRRPDAILCPNGVDLAHFAAGDGADDGAIPANVPEDMRPVVATGQPVIGYYGALAEWFDFDLVKHAAQALPDCQFVLIGPDYDGLTMRNAAIDAHANIHWLGPKQYAELPRYLACFDVATIPFKVSDAINAVSPIKLFEYMAGGRPIVTTDLVECRKYPVVLIARTPEEWVERLREAMRLRHDDAYLDRVRRTAEENTWVTRALTEIQALEARRAGGGSHIAQGHPVPETLPAAH